MSSMILCLVTVRSDGVGGARQVQSDDSTPPLIPRYNNDNSLYRWYPVQSWFTRFHESNTPCIYCLNLLTGMCNNNIVYGTLKYLNKCVYHHCNLLLPLPLCPSPFPFNPTISSFQTTRREISCQKFLLTPFPPFDPF